jgi:hypothetical protein
LHFERVDNLGAYRIPSERPTFSLRKQLREAAGSAASIGSRVTLVPKLLEPLHQIPLETVGMNAIEVISAKIFVVALVLLQVIANDYEGMCHRDDGSLLAASRG